MNKKFLPLFALASIGVVLTACGPKSSTPAQDRSYFYTPSEIITNYSSLNMYAGDSVQIKPFIMPIKAYNAKLTYVSDDERVAKVNQDGVVSAIGNGFTTILINYSDDLIEINLKEIPVTVNRKVTIGDELDKAVSDMQKTQKAKYPNGVDKLRVKENRKTSLYKNDVLQTTQDEECTMVGSISQAYFFIRDVYTETRVPDGAITIDDFDWYIFGDADYNANLYYRSEAGRKRMIKPAQSYLGKPRVEITYHLLDSIFSSGQGIMTNLYKNVLSSDEFSNYTRYKSLEKYGGIGDNAVSYELTQNNYTYTSDYDDERYSDIPYGVKVIQDYFQNILWVDGIVRTLDIQMVNKYKFKNEDYKRVTSVQYSFNIEDEVTIEYPEDSMYQEVYNLFDLF